MNITMTKTTPATRVWFASPHSADRGLTVAVGMSYRGSNDKAPGFKDVAQLRSGRPPV